MADALTAGEIAAFHERATEPANGGAQCWSNWVIAELCDAARESLRLRGLIDAHSAAMHSECESRAQHGTLCAAMQRTSRKRCVDCPRDNVIDADAAPGDVSRAAAPAPPAPPAPESSCPR